MKLLLLFGFIFLSTNFIYSQNATEKKDDLKNCVSISGKTKGNITKDELLNSKGLTINENEIKNYQVSSFKMTLVCKNRKNSVLEAENNKNGELNSNMIELIKNAESGCKIFFEYIKIASDNNQTSTTKCSAFQLVLI